MSLTRGLTAFINGDLAQLTRRMPAVDRREWKVNFATALLPSDNRTGCVGVRAKIHNESHIGVQCLRAALRRWHRPLPVWDKCRWFFGGQPSRRVELDFLPGEL